MNLGVDGSDKDIPEPRRMRKDRFLGRTIEAIAAGAQHTVILTSKT